MISCFQVTVRDNGRPPLSSTTRIVIEVADVNDHGPEFEQKFYTVQIPASPATDKPLFQVQISSSFSAIFPMSFSFIRVSCKYIFTPANEPGHRTKADSATQISPDPAFSVVVSHVKSANLCIPLYIYIPRVTCEIVLIRNANNESSRDTSV